MFFLSDQQIPDNVNLPPTVLSYCSVLGCMFQFLAALLGVNARGLLGIKPEQWRLLLRA